MAWRPFRPLPRLPQPERCEGKVRQRLHMLLARLSPLMLRHARATPCASRLASSPGTPGFSSSASTDRALVEAAERRAVTSQLGILLSGGLVTHKSLAGRCPQGWPRFPDLAIALCAPRDGRTSRDGPYWVKSLSLASSRSMAGCNPSAAFFRWCLARAMPVSVARSFRIRPAARRRLDRRARALRRSTRSVQQSRC